MADGKFFEALIKRDETQHTSTQNKMTRAGTSKDIQQRLAREQYNAASNRSYTAKKYSREYTTNPHTTNTQLSDKMTGRHLKTLRKLAQRECKRKKENDKLTVRFGREVEAMIMDKGIIAQVNKLINKMEKMKEERKKKEKSTKYQQKTVKNKNHPDVGELNEKQMAQAFKEVLAVKEELVQQKKKLLQANKELQKGNDNLTQDKDHLVKRNNQLSKENDVLADTVEFDQQPKVLLQQKEELEKEKDLLVIENDSLTKQKDDLMKDRDHLIDQENQRGKELDDVTQQNLELESRFNTINAKLENAEQKLAEKHMQLAASEKMHVNFSNEIETLKTKLLEMQEAKHNQDCCAAKPEMQKMLERQLSDADTQLKIVREKLQLLAEEKTALEITVKETLQQLEMTVKQNVDLLHKSEELSLQLKASYEQVQVLQKGNAHSDEREKKLIDKIEAQEDQSRELKQTMSKLEKAEVDLRDATLSIQQKDAFHEEIVMENLRLQEKCVMLQEKLSTFTSQSDIAEKMQKLHASIVEDQKLLQQLKVEMSQHQQSLLFPFQQDKQTSRNVLDVLNPLDKSIKRSANQLSESKMEVYEILQTLTDTEEQRKQLKIDLNNIRSGKKPGKKQSTFPPKQTQVDDALIKSLNRVNADNADLKKEATLLLSDYESCKAENTRLSSKNRELECELSNVAKELLDGNILQEKANKLNDKIISLQAQVKKLETDKIGAQHCIDLLQKDVENYRKNAANLQVTAKSCCLRIKSSKEMLEEELADLRDEHSDCKGIMKKYQKAKQEVSRLRKMLVKTQEMASKNCRSSEELMERNLHNGEKNVINLQLLLDQNKIKQEDNKITDSLKEDIVKLQQEIIELQSKQMRHDTLEAKQSEERFQGSLGNNKTEGDQHQQAIKKEKEGVEYQSAIMQKNEDIEMTCTQQQAVNTNGNSQSLQLKISALQNELQQYKRKDDHFLEVEKQSESIQNELQQFKEMKEIDQETIRCLQEEITILSTQILKLEQKEKTYEAQMSALNDEVMQLKKRDEDSNNRKELHLMGNRLKEMNTVKEQNENTIKKLKEDKDDLQMTISKMDREIVNLKDKLEFAESSRIERRPAVIEQPSAKPPPKMNSKYPAWLGPRHTNGNDDDIPPRIREGKSEQSPAWLKPRSKNNVNEEISSRETADDDFIDDMPVVRGRRQMSPAGRRQTQQTGIEQSHVSYQRQSPSRTDDEEDQLLNESVSQRRNTQGRRSATRPRNAEYDAEEIVTGPREQINSRNQTPTQKIWQDEDDNFLSLDSPSKINKNTRSSYVPSTQSGNTVGRRHTAPAKTTVDTDDDLLNFDGFEKLSRNRSKSNKRVAWVDEGSPMTPQARDKKDRITMPDEETKPVTNVKYIYESTWSDDEDDLMNKCLNRRKF